MASGSACDCFDYKIENEHRSAGFYSMSYYVLQKPEHAHDNNNFGNFRMVVSFNKTIDPTWSITPPPTAKSGSTITWNIDSTISPYYKPIDGMTASNYGINVKGDGVEDLKCTKIETHHY